MIGITPTPQVVAVICLIICSVTYVIGQMKGIGVAFSRFLETDYETGLLSGMVIVFFYAVLGGMKGITYTQIAQFCVLIFAYTVPAIFISLQLTGQPIPQLGLGSTLADGTYLLEKLDQTLLDLGFQEYTTAARQHAQYGRLHRLADDRHGGFAPRDHPFLHGADCACRQNVCRLGAGLLPFSTPRHLLLLPWRA